MSERLAQTVEILRDIKFWIAFTIILIALPGLKIPGAFNIPVGLVFSVLAAGPFIWRIKKYPPHRAEWLFILFIAALGVSFLWSLPRFEIAEGAVEAAKTDIHFSRWRFIWQFGAWGMGLIAVYFFARSTMDVVHFRWVVKLMTYAGVAVAIWAVYELLARWLDLPYLNIANGNWSYRPQAAILIGDINIFRPYSTQEEPKALAQFLMIPFFLTISRWTAGAGIRWLAAASLVLLIFLWTGSTPAYVGMAFAAILWAVLSIRGGVMVRRKEWIRIAIAGSLAIVVASILFGGQLSAVFGYHFDRFYDVLNAEIDDHARAIGVVRTYSSVATDYLVGWSDSWQLFRDNPIFGIGLGNGPLISGVYDRVFTPFSVYLSIMSEAGLIGLLTLALFLGYVIVRATRTVLNRALPMEKSDRASVIAIIAALVGSLPVYQTFGGTRFEMHEWLLLGVLIGASTMASAKWSAR